MCVFLLQGTAAGRWVEEKFRLPLSRAGLSPGDDSNKSDVKDNSAKIEAAEGQPLAALDTEENDSSGNGGDNDLHLRIEVWQGGHCHGQVSRRVSPRNAVGFPCKVGLSSWCRGESSRVP